MVSAMARKRVLVLFPSIWDSKQLASCRPAWQRHYDIELGAPTYENCPYDLHPLAYIDEVEERYRGQIDGVISSNDYPGATIAAALAERLGLPGPSPEAVVRATHKYYSRCVQREAVAEATPKFWLIDPTRPDGGAPDLEYPCFIKPVKGTFSVLSQKLNDSGELHAFLARPVVKEFIDDYMTIFNRQVAGLTDFEIDGRFFVAEGFMHGTQVTVEGCIARGAVMVYGVVDSVMHPATSSFGRFDLPSALRPEIQDQMHEIARRTVVALGLDDCIFNVEMIYQPLDDSIRIVEINPRICGQFGDLYEKVLGIHSYLIALAVVTGAPLPELPGGGAYAMATSFPLRTFEPVTVLEAPDAARITAAERLYAGTLIWNECEAGVALADFQTFEDGSSARYAVVNLGADSRAELNARLAAIKVELAHRFERA
jgi:biotin carboxylase